MGTGTTTATDGRQPASWMLPRRTKRKILAGDYNDFDVILTEVTTNSGGVPMATKASVSGPNRRTVRDIGSWLQVWSAYAATVLLADPARGYELIGYQSIVAEASSEYQTSAWLKYDRASLFRQQVHGRKMGHDLPPPMGSVFHRSRSNLCHLLYMWSAGPCGNRLLTPTSTFVPPDEQPHLPGNISNPTSGKPEICRLFRADRCKNQASPSLCKIPTQMFYLPRRQPRGHMFPHGHQ